MTVNRTQPRTSRRGAFTAALRYLAAGVLGVGAAGAVARRKRLLYEGKCINRNVCRDCRILNECGLPLALSSKQAGVRKTDDVEE
jgi:hypothetical protein